MFRILALVAGVGVEMNSRDETVVAVRRVTYAGMALNVALAAAKAACGVIFLSHALLADAIHSLSDLLTDFAVILGVKYWEAPPDANHPYGHGKIQALVTLFIAFMLLAVAWGLGDSAVRALLAGPVATPGFAACVVAVVSVVVKEGLYQWTVRVARRVKSPALAANAWHHRSDALSSIPVACAIALAYFFPSASWVDAMGALVVAFFLAYMVWKLAYSAFQELTDAVMEGKSTAVLHVARGVKGVYAVHRCRARRYGGAYQADLHVQVDPALTIVDAHRIGHAVKDALLAADIDVADATVHVEPFRGTSALPRANVARTDEGEES